MASLTRKSPIRVAGEHTGLAAYIGGLAVALAVLVCAVPARPRVFAALLEDAAVGNRLGRRLLLGAVVVAGSVVWPVALAGIAARAAVMGDGRHRLGAPHETVRRRPWDWLRRAEAGALNEQESVWTVLYGPWSRAFRVFTGWPVPRALAVTVSGPEVLWEKMRVAETAGALAGRWA